MNDYLPISLLNDFFFCPYSIYLHNVYMESDESQYHAAPQTVGRMAHKTIDEQKSSTGKGDLISTTVSSNRLMIYGKIDWFRFSTKTLIERKYKLNNIFRGQIYQLWAQYICLKEMGTTVENLAFYETSTNKMVTMPPPTLKETNELISFISKIREYDPSSDIDVNINKCRHCIYCNLCDKICTDNVYI